MNEIETLIHEMKEVKKEVVEARNLTIKTDNNMRSIFAEMKKVDANQKQAEQKARVNGIGVYALFAVVIGVAFYLLLSLQGSSLNDEIEGLQSELQRVSANAAATKLELDSREAMRKSAMGVYKLIQEKDKENAVVEFKKLNREKLSEVAFRLLEEKIGVFREELARKHYDQGVQQWRIGGYKSAVQEFGLSKDFLDKSDYSGMLSYYRGLSLLKLKRNDEGIESLKEAVAAGIEKEPSDKARLEVAEAYIGAKRYDEALNYLKGLPQDQLGYWTRLAAQQKIKWVSQQIEAQRVAAEKKSE